MSSKNYKNRFVRTGLMPPLTVGEVITQRITSDQAVGGVQKKLENTDPYYVAQFSVCVYLCLF